MIALNGGRPEMLTLTDMLRAFLDFREEVVTRRTKYLLTKARDGAHMQVGLAIAVANIDEVIRLIRTSPDSATARTALMERVWPARDMAPFVTLIADPRHALDADGAIRLSEAQARAILELRLARLTALGRDEIAEALNRLSVEIADYLDILGSRARLMGIIRDELVKVKTDFATPRRTIILDSDADMEDEDLIQREDMVVLVSHGGYIKRAPLSTYRAQRRGGKGRGAMATRDEDFVARLFVASTHQPVLFFSSAGQVYKEKVWRLPLAAPQSRGKALVNLLPLEQGERITTIMPLPEDEASWEALDVMFATTRGTVRRNKLRLRPGEPLRQDRDAARRGRADRRRPDLLRQGRRPADHARAASASAFQSMTCGCSRAAIRWACAASRSPRATASSRSRSSIVRREPGRTRRLSQAAPRGSRGRGGGGRSEPDAEGENGVEANGAALEPERFEAMRAAEQVILDISENGYGKRTSSFDIASPGAAGKASSRWRSTRAMARLSPRSRWRTATRSCW